MGEIADLNDHFNRDLDPRSVKGWTEERKLSAAFLETILLHDPWRRSVPRQGVRIVGAWFEETVDLEEANTAHQLWLDGSWFSAGLNLSRTRAASALSLEGSFINGTLGLSGTKFENQISLTGVKIAGTLNMDSADIGQGLFMHSNPERRAELQDVILRGAKVGGQVTLTGVKVGGTLDMDSVDVGENLLMRSNQEEDAKFRDVILLDAKVGGQVDLTGAKIAGRLNMDSANIGQSVYMDSTPERRAEFKEVDLTSARIGSNLDLRGAALSSLDLTGTRVQGELRLASSSRGRPIWADDGQLTLRNATVDALQDEPEAWPGELDLDGFVYGRLGGLETNPSVDVAARGSEWFVDWLARDQPFTPQPYEQLATVLREMGHGEEANDVLFAGRERARKRAWGDGHWQSWIGQTLLKLTVGYGFGYRYFWALYWVAGLVLIATIVLGITGQNQRTDRCIGIWYSLDMLLPIIQLRQAHYDIDLQGFAGYYFYFHKIMGYVLASFLIAGVAGLTQ